MAKSYGLVNTIEDVRALFAKLIEEGKPSCR